MTAPALVLLPVAPETAGSRTVSDRLEILTALMAAPTFDPLFRTEIICLPADHPAYGWICGVPDCERSRGPQVEYCATHNTQWRQTRAEGTSVVDFLRIAAPLKVLTWHNPPDCLVCPGVPAVGRSGLCYLHKARWARHRFCAHKGGQAADFDAWLSSEHPVPGFGSCQVVVCPELAVTPLGLCGRHLFRYKRQGLPGGAQLPAQWGRWLSGRGEPVPVSYSDEAQFRRWCHEAGTISRMNGKVSLLGLRPLARAEVQWSLFHHTQRTAEGGRWAASWLQYLADDCRGQDVGSLADLDIDECRPIVRGVVKTMLHYLRLVYFGRHDTKDAGFIETDHFGVRFSNRGSHLDLSGVSQRWLRDMLWEWMAGRLLNDPPRSRNPFEVSRRGCLELSAFLETRAPGGGHTPSQLTADHMIDFVADQRHRAANGLNSLAIHSRRAHGPTPATKSTVGTVFNGARRILRDAMESGKAEEIGLSRAFIVALPSGGFRSGRRRPFPDDVARALATEENLLRLDALDSEDRGLRDIWEALVLTGRRCTEVLSVRLECITRLNGLPLFWHDQTKVGNFDQAIRIPERLFLRIEKRQEKTMARFIQHKGRPPTVQERVRLALFPRRPTNREGLKAVSYTWFSSSFRGWIDTLDIVSACVPHQARHTLATNLLKNGADLTHVKRYLGQISNEMAEHYVHLANTDPRLESALQALWVSGPGSAEPGILLSGGEPMTREEAEALAIDLTRRSTPADGGFCTFQPVVNGDACPWNLNCHSCDKFVMSGADLVYWHRKREQWRMLAERAPDSATADYLHEVFEPTARAIDGLEKALEAAGLLDEALALDMRRPQDYFGRVWSTAFRAQELAYQQDGGEAA